MQLKINKEDLASLIAGSFVPYELVENPVLNRYGRYVGGFVDEWKWNKASLLCAAEETLLEIYHTLKDSCPL